MYLPASPVRVFSIASMRAPRHTNSRRCGFSLVEIMVATLISLMVIGAAVTLFGVIGEKVTAGRAGIETSDHVRAAQDALRRDLQSVTATMLPWESPAAANGYFEIIKGNGPKNRDSVPQSVNDSPLQGYTNDFLLFTIRSKDRPFVGRYGNATIQSQVAEVAWFMAPTVNSAGQQTTPMTYTLYRRMFLVLPGLAPQGAANFYASYDISAHVGGNGQMIPNSLADLTYRENRFAHNANSYPFLVNSVANDPSTLAPFSNSSQRYGEDAVLTNVLGFDVKVWDPNAIVMQDVTNPNTPLVPSDPGYGSAKTALAPGAYVDLNYANGASLTGSYFSSTFVGAGAKASSLAPTPSNQTFPLTWDSWSSGYEYYASGNGFAAYGQNGNVGSGFDDSSQRGVSNAGQRQTSPPYPVPLRGVRVKIRVYEPVARQVREVTVDETFTPD